jgi:hypothetical protein
MVLGQRGMAGRKVRDARDPCVFETCGVGQACVPLVSWVREGWITVAVQGVWWFDARDPLKIEQ